MRFNSQMSQQNILDYGHDFNAILEYFAMLTFNYMMHDLKKA